MRAELTEAKKGGNIFNQPVVCNPSRAELQAYDEMLEREARLADQLSARVATLRIRLGELLAEQECLIAVLEPKQ